MDRRLMCMKKSLTQSVVDYINVYDHNIQTSSSLQPLGQLKPNFMWSIVR